MFYKFQFDSRSSADLRATQGVAFDGTNYYTCADTSNDSISKWTRAGDVFTLHPGPASNPRNVSGSWPAGQAQINHMVYHDPGDGGGPRLWVGGNNYPTTPKLGWVQEYDPDTLEFIRSHDTEAHWSEAGDWRPDTNEFWVCYDDKYDSAWKIDKYTYDNNAFTHQGTFELKGLSYGSGTHFHNGLVWYGGSKLMASVHEGTRPVGVELYDYNDGEFNLIQTILPPTQQCSQGFCRSGNTFFFAERFYPDGAADDHRILQATLVQGQPKARHFNVLDAGSSQATGLVAWYPLNEGRGTEAKEVVGGTPGTYVNCTWEEDPVANWVPKLDGSTSYIDLVDHFTAGLSEAMVMFWCKPDVGDGSNILISGNAAGSNAGDWQARVDAAVPIGIDFFYDNGTTLSSGDAGGNGGVPYRTWVHVCVAIDGSGAYIYLNGQLVKSNAVAGTMGGTAQGLRVGASLTGVEHFAGAFRDLRVYDAYDPAVIAAAANPATADDLRVEDWYRVFASDDWYRTYPADGWWLE